MKTTFEPSPRYLPDFHIRPVYNGKYEARQARVLARRGHIEADGSLTMPITKQRALAFDTRRCLGCDNRVNVGIVIVRAPVCENAIV